MTYPSGGSVFDDDVQTVKKYFEKWSPSERAIAVCTILKHFQFPLLRFIQSKIEATNGQNYDSEKMKLMEQKSNDRTYINELCNTYKLLTNAQHDVQSKDSTFFESDRLLDNSSTISFNNNNNNNNYSNNNVHVGNVADKFSTKEEILTEILNCILMLKIGNDDVIQEYLALIPYMVHDTQNHKINFEIVMQTLSILVAHPALSSDDLRMVMDHTAKVKTIIQNQNSNLTAIAPPLYAYNNAYKTPIFGSSLTSVASLSASQNDHIETGSISPGRSSVGENNYYIGVPCHRCLSTTNDDQYSVHTAADDQNTSFSKNGTVINDISDSEQTNSQFQKNLQIQNLLIESLHFKQRRSNSLTTGGMKPYEGHYSGIHLTSSAENLQFAQSKPRRYSLSTEDDIKPAYQAFQTHHSGMKYVGHWLKKLRLHKYCMAFEEMSFDSMMRIDEQYLERLGITQGARTKMINSIQKLKERHARLKQAEQDLKCNKMTIEAATQLLTDTIDTPMKPIDAHDFTNVAAQFLSLLTLVCDMVKSKVIDQQDEEVITQLTEIFNIMQLGNTEPFQNQVFRLKDLRFDIEAIKRQFPPHNHYSRNGNGLINGNANKSRWPIRSDRMHPSENKPHRKNSNPSLTFNNYVSAQQVQKPQKSQSGSKTKQVRPRNGRQEFNNGYHQTPVNIYGNPESYGKSSSKSSSYPNCSSSSNNSQCSRSNGQHNANVNNQNANPQLHYSQNRHSANNLSAMAARTTVTVTPAAPIPQQQKTSNCVGHNFNGSLMNGIGRNRSESFISSDDYCYSCGDNGYQFYMDLHSDSVGSHSTSYSNQTANKHLLGDISPYKHLDSLSKQMTEQAIN